MKSLLILRHAKAQPDAPHGDHPRELTKRGRRNATAMGAHIRALAGTPDAIVTSDARRAFQTAELAAAAMEFDHPLTIEPRIYDADLDDLLAVVRNLPDEAATVVLVGHNPGFEELAEELATRDADEVVLPTAGLAHLEFDVGQWHDVQPGTGRLRGVHTRHTIA
jgi:phosphohistidine phosphatase